MFACCDAVIADAESLHETVSEGVDCIYLVPGCRLNCRGRGNPSLLPGNVDEQRAFLAMLLPKVESVPYVVQLFCLLQ
jgi:hypothetical protein